MLSTYKIYLEQRLKKIIQKVSRFCFNINAFTWFLIITRIMGLRCFVSIFHFVSRIQQVSQREIALRHSVPNLCGGTQHFYFFQLFAQTLERKESSSGNRIHNLSHYVPLCYDWPEGSFFGSVGILKYVTWQAIVTRLTVDADATKHSFSKETETIVYIFESRMCKEMKMI